ncbi:substrate-binding domain-containing protein [Amycolatopsis acidicola]|uniref:Substrate-binding domain-containing protein n=1 Tax=Amycolatopsis acidicola TaxID=2596893 RepID=A0A5N0V0X8_9PSEU|nr:alpha/beta hydrolase-fold protein [Amycolatopsis acidicola]KAA9159081.1 substrate-binding domain-containing protein [Amycolatopsis acidicola]
MSAAGAPAFAGSPNQNRPQAGPAVTHTGTAPTGYTVTFRYYDPDATRVQISGQWYFEPPNGKPGDQVLPAQWKPGYYQLGYPDGGPTSTWPTADMKEIGNSGMWEYTTPMPSGYYGYGFYVDCGSDDPHAAGCAQVPDPANPAWQLPADVAGAGSLKGSYVSVPSDANFRTEDASWLAPVKNGGTLTAVSYQSDPALLPAGADPKRPLAVYLPPGYDPHRSTPYPTVYLIHGREFYDAQWTSAGDLKNIMDNLILDGLMEPAVVVMPDFDGYKTASIQPPDVCVTQPSAWLTQFAQDMTANVIPYVQAHYDVANSASGRALAGLSQGGCVANSLMFNETSVFGYYGIMSPAAAVPTVAEAEAKQAELRKAGIMVGGGWQEPIPSAEHPSYPAPRTEVANLQAAGVGVTPEFVNGGHAWNVWSEMLRDFLRTVAFKPVVGGDPDATQASQTAAINMAKASEGIQPYVGQPTEFPVTTALKTVPKGAKITFVQCGTPFCAGIYTQLQAAAQAMGVSLTQVALPANADAGAISSAFDSIVDSKPDAVIVAGLEVSQWASQAKALQQQKIPIVTTGVNDAADYGIVAPQEGEQWLQLLGKLMADYVEAKVSCVPGSTATCAASTGIAVYDMSALGFTAPIVGTFTSEAAAVCTGCTTRTVDLPAADMGPGKATADIVADLKAHPGTSVVVLPVNHVATADLPAALAQAGLKVSIVGYDPSADNLRMIKDGAQTAGLAQDSAIASWTLLDIAAREITGQQLDSAETAGLPVMQFLASGDITFDPAKGWSAYPGYAARFTSLWTQQ